MEEKRKFDFQKYNNEYKKLNYDRLNFLMPKGTKEKIHADATRKGISSAEWLRQAIAEKLEAAD